MKKITALALSLALLLSGCSKEDKSADNMVLSKSYPWNNGVVYENDYGYFLTGSGVLYTAYYDKTEKKQIMLCNRPECPHDGRDSCPATKMLICSNTWLYNNSLFFLGEEITEEEMTVSLFRAAADGSSLDRLKILMSEKLTSSSDGVSLDYAYFEIKDGIAYASFSPCYGHGGYGGFIGRKFVRIDLNDNYSTREIESSDDFFGPYIEDFHICGDYVMAIKNYGNGSNGLTGTRVVRISVENDEITDTSYDNEKIKICGYDNERFYCERGPEKGEGGRFVFAVDPETLEKTWEINMMDYTAQSVLSYEGKQYIFHQGNPVVSVYENGKEISSVNYKPAQITDYDVFLNEYGISDGKLYVLQIGDIYGKREKMYSCSLDSLLSGEPEWQEVYDMNEYSNNTVACYRAN